MVKKVHIYLIFAITVVISLFMAGCKKKEVVYPPLLTETEVLERLKETYGEEFVIHNKTDLLSLGEVVKAPGPYSDIAEGIVYEASPVNDPSFLFKVYTYRAYGNVSPIPFSRSGGVQPEPEYYECFGQDLLNIRFKEEADKYGILYETEYQGFSAYSTMEETGDSIIDEESFHIRYRYYIYINESDINAMAEKISLCLKDMMQTYEYKEGMNFSSTIFIRVKFKDKGGNEKMTSSIGRGLFGKYGDERFDATKEKLIEDMEMEVTKRRG